LRHVLSLSCFDLLESCFMAWLMGFIAHLAWNWLILDFKFVGILFEEAGKARDEAENNKELSQL
jgi:hypothetical protein